MSEVLKTAYNAALAIQDEAKRDVVINSLAPDASCYEQVEAFHVLYDAPVVKTPTEGVPSMDQARLDLRIELIDEEFKELKEATAKRDIVEMADALGDILYVTVGFALEAGIDLQAVVREIQASNMTKLGGDGNPVISDGSGQYPAGKVLKGPNYAKPNIKAVLFPE